MDICATIAVQKKCAVEGRTMTLPRGEKLRDKVSCCGCCISGKDGLTVLMAKGGGRKSTS
jgi:hypothetical protein